MAAQARQAYDVLVREGKKSYKLLLIRYFLESQLRCISFSGKENGCHRTSLLCSQAMLAIL